MSKNTLLDEDLIPFEPNRIQMAIEIGAMVGHGDYVYRIAQILDFKTVVGIEVESGKASALPIGALNPLKRQKVDGLYVNYDVASIGVKDWATARERFATIEPLLGGGIVGRREVQARSDATGVDVSTIYRWLKLYKEWGELLSLVPRKRGWQEGNARISPEAGQIIERVLKDFYLKKHRPTIQATIKRIKETCEAEDVTAPGVSTIRERIKSVPDREFLRGRGFAEKARNKYSPSPGSFPGASYPLAVVQIDHTPLDVLLVDDVHRKSIGRVWVTFSIDVHTRMITGYYLALDAPAGISVAMCVAHSILPKEEWLIAHGIDGEWPVWGIPKILHSDNGPDFQSGDLKRSCSNYGIENRFRPVKRPKFGGHIERLMGTFAQTLKDLPGKTYSNKEDRDGYDSDANAALTFSEFEKWLVREILIYNESYHSGIYMSPSRKWHLGIFGNADLDPLVGVPPRPSDAYTIQRDFLPSFERTIQHYGVQLDVFYYSEALRPWINAKDEKTGKTRTFIFRRDPRDISMLWFYEPLLKQYYKIPVANQAFPAASVWEFQAAKKKAVDEGHANVNEALIKRYILENRELVNHSESTTKKARRQAQRQRVHSKGSTPANPTPKPVQTATPLPIEFSNLISGDLDDFGDIS